MNREAAFHFNRAEKLFRERDAVNAWVDLDKAIELDPDNWEYRKRRAELYYEFEEHELAIEDFTALIAFCSDVDELKNARSHRAYSYGSLGLYNKLIEDLTWIIEHGTENVNICTWCGYHNTRQGNLQAAIANFSQAHELSPDNEDILYQLALCHYLLGQYETTIDKLTEYLTLAEKHPARPSLLLHVYHWRGSAFWELGDHESALTDFNAVMKCRIELDDTLSDADGTLSDASEYVRKYGLGVKAGYVIINPKND